MFCPFGWLVLSGVWVPPLSPPATGPQSSYNSPSTGRQDPRRSTVGACSLSVCVRSFDRFPKSQVWEDRSFGDFLWANLLMQFYGVLAIVCFGRSFRRIAFRKLPFRNFRVSTRYFWLRFTTSTPPFFEMIVASQPEPCWYDRTRFGSRHNCVDSRTKVSQPSICSKLQTLFGPSAFAKYKER